jgi:hypothetical protein
VRQVRRRLAPLRTLRFMQGMLSGAFLVAAFVVVAAAAVFVAARLYRISRPTPPREPPDA